jgi:hypothetical protein
MSLACDWPRQGLKKQQQAQREHDNPRRDTLQVRHTVRQRGRPRDVLQPTQNSVNSRRVSPNKRCIMVGHLASSFDPAPSVDHASAYTKPRVH